MASCHDPVAFRPRNLMSRDLGAREASFSPFGSPGLNRKP